MLNSSAEPIFLVLDLLKLRAFPVLVGRTELSGRKIRKIEAARDDRDGSAVFTRAGRYTAQGWTEWTEGFEVSDNTCKTAAQIAADLVDVVHNALTDPPAPAPVAAATPP